MDLRRAQMVNGRMRVGLLTSGIYPEQNFNRRTFVLKGVSEGWITLSDDEKTLTLHGVTDDGVELDLVFEVLRVPGYYCRSTGERIPLSRFAEEESFTAAVATLAAAEAQKWLKAKGLKADDYEAPKVYSCRLGDAMHAKWRAVKNAAGNWVAAHTLEG